MIRLKDRDRKNAYGVKLPDQPEFDLPVRLTLGRLTVRQLKQRGLPLPERYYQIPGSITFDYLEPESDNFYTFSARIVRLKLADGSTQMLITDLDPSQFSLLELQELYAKRWGIETSFRELKYTVGLIHLHSRKSDLVLQEIFAAFTVFNFTQAVTWSTDEAWGRSKYERRVDFSQAGRRPARKDNAVWRKIRGAIGTRIILGWIVRRAYTSRRQRRLVHRAEPRRSLGAWGPSVTDKLRRVYTGALLAAVISAHK